MKKEINAFIVKYGDFAGVTLQEAQKIIDEFDVKAFQEEAKDWSKTRTLAIEQMKN